MPGRIRGPNPLFSVLFALQTKGLINLFLCKHLSQHLILQEQDSGTSVFISKILVKQINSGIHNADQDTTSAQPQCLRRLHRQKTRDCSCLIQSKIQPLWFLCIFNFLCICNNGFHQLLRNLQNRIISVQLLYPDLRKSLLQCFAQPSAVFDDNLPDVRFRIKSDI